MSFGFGIGDFIAISTFAWKVYRSCKGSCDEFKNISGEVVGLHIILLETKEFLAENRQTLGADREAYLGTLGEGCRDVLMDLEKLLEKYKSLGSKMQRTWE